MKKKYSKEEKNKIAEEAISTKNKSEVSLKYDIHLSTLYDWINKKNASGLRTERLNLKVTENEKRAILKKCEEMGYQKDVSSYVRKLLFSKHIATGNPREIIKELYSARAELNKSGSNLNQIANYTNFLRSQNYFEDGFVKDLNNQMEQMEIDLAALRKVIDKTLRKI